MFEKLNHVVRRYEEITQKLSSGSLGVKDLQELSKEESQLKDIVETYQDYQNLKSQITNNKNLLAEENDEAMKELIKNDLKELEEKLQKSEQDLKFLLIPRDPLDEKNIILEIRAGTGGDEAALFCADLFRMYSRFAEEHRWKVEILSSNATGQGGFKEIVVMISGSQVYSKLKFEGGTHRVQRVPKTESSGRIHTSACTVAVLPEADDVEINLKENELTIDVFRSGGAGGQSVNTTDSAVRVTHIPTGLVVICQDERSQHKNKAKALKVLKARLYDKMLSEQHEKEASKRKLMVGSGDRSEKIRTYNFPQSRVTDHRINLTLHQLDQVLDGRIDPLLDALTTQSQAEALKQV